MPKFEIRQERTADFNKLPPLERQGIYDLEKSWLAPYTTKCILAAFVGIKRCSAIELNALSEEAVDEQERELESILRRLGLNFEKQRRRVEGEYRSVYTRYFFSKSEVPKEAQKFLNPPGLSDEDHKEFGRLMGIPKTAIDAFIKEKDERTSHLPYAMPQDTPEAKFTWFAPSNEHWEEELLPVTEFADRVKRISPILYQRILRDS